MSGFVYSVLGFLVAIAILVTVHEFGHFWVARRLGVSVLKFSIGFGKPVCRWRRKNDPTEYVIGAIPLGGYIKMLDERESEVAEHERHRAFNRQSLPVRSAIVVAGPAFNFLFAIAAIWLVFVIGTPDIEPVVGEVAADSIAADAGFSAGDRIQSIDGRAVRSWGEHQFYLLHQAMKGAPVVFLVRRKSGEQRALAVDFAALDQIEIGRRAVTSQLGIWPPAPPAVAAGIVPDSPAAGAGLQPGDRILAINDDAIADWGELVAAVSSRPGARLRIRLQRQGQTHELSLVSAAVVVAGKKFGQIGVYPPPLANTRFQLGVWHALLASIDYNWRLSIITLRSLGRMLSAKMAPDNLSGPITIARMAGDTAASGYIDFLKFLAIISISLGLLNLLPIPVLDGGHLLYFLIEAVTGAPPSEAVAAWGQQIGIALLVLLMGVALYNDVLRLVGAL